MNRRRKKWNGVRFVAIDHPVLDSDAFAALSGAAAKALLLLLRRWNGPERNNNGALPLSWRDVKTYCHVRSDSVRAVQNELAASRLAVPVKKGAFTWKVRHATTWRICFLPTATEPADWSAIRPQNSEHGTRSGSSTAPAVGADARANGSKKPQSAPAVGADSAFLGSRSGSTSKVQGGCPRPGASAPRAPIGTSRDKSAWLRSWLANGRVTSAEVAHTVGIGHGDVEALAAGKTVIGNTSWQKLAELVASKVH
jgi:hypothetical protein